MRGTRFFVWLIAGMILCSILINGFAEERWYYRVIAKNDTMEAQQEKTRVRDAALAACPKNGEELADSLDSIKKAAESIAPCRVEIKAWSPDEKTPLAPTLYITVGAGQGHNCWGVLYPDSLEMAKAGDIPEEPERVEFVWPIWSWILSLFGL